MGNVTSPLPSSSADLLLTLFISVFSSYPINSVLLDPIKFNERLLEERLKESESQNDSDSSSSNDSSSSDSDSDSSSDGSVSFQ